MPDVHPEEQRQISCKQEAATAFVAALCLQPDFFRAPAAYAISVQGLQGPSFISWLLMASSNLVCSLKRVMPSFPKKESTML